MTRRPLAVLREAYASALAQPVASIMTILVVLGVVLTVMLTTGRTVGAEQRVLESIDDAGTRTIQVRAENGSGLNSDVLTRIERIEGIEWAAAFSAAIDVTNSRLVDGERVPVRLAYGEHLGKLGLPSVSPLPGELAYASPLALQRLGLSDVSGSITTTSGNTYAMAGAISTPDFLTGLEPVVLVPQPGATGSETINILIVIAERPDLVAPVSDAVVSVLTLDDPTKASVHTSEALAQLRVIVQSQLVTFSRGLVLVTLLVTGLLVAVILYALVLLRRRDFGRRRALGASRGLIIALLLVQTTLLSAVGVVVGLVASIVTLSATDDPLPGPAFTGALAILVLTTAAVSAVIPAIVASTREPIRELRVP